MHIQVDHVNARLCVIVDDIHFSPYNHTHIHTHTQTHAQTHTHLHTHPLTHAPTYTRIRTLKVCAPALWLCVHDCRKVNERIANQTNHKLLSTKHNEESQQHTSMLVRVRRTSTTTMKPPVTAMLWTLVVFFSMAATIGAIRIQHVLPDALATNALVPDADAAARPLESAFGEGVAEESVIRAKVRAREGGVAAFLRKRADAESTDSGLSPTADLPGVWTPALVRERVGVDPSDPQFAASDPALDLYMPGVRFVLGWLRQVGIRACFLLFT